MPKGRPPSLPSICSICGKHAGNNENNRWAHVREGHGATGLTKTKAVELYPLAERSQSVNMLQGNATVWTVDYNGNKKIWAEPDLFHAGIVEQIKERVVYEPTRPVPEHDTPTTIARSPPKLYTAAEKASADPEPQPQKQSPLLQLDNDLRQLRDHLKKAVELLERMTA